MKNKALEKAIAESRLSFTETAKLADISTNQLRLLISGNADNPRATTIKNLSKVLKVPVTKLGFF